MITRAKISAVRDRYKVSYEAGSEINFFRQAPTGSWNFFSVATWKKLMWSPKSVNKIFHPQWNTNQNFWWPDGKFCSPMFLLRIRTIFPRTNIWLNTNIPTTQKPPRTNWMVALIYTEFRATSNWFMSFLHLLDVQSSILDVQSHYKQTDTFQYTNFYSCHPPGVKKGFIKGEALRLLRTNSWHSTFHKKHTDCEFQDTPKEQRICWKITLWAWTKIHHNTYVMENRWKKMAVQLHTAWSSRRWFSHIDD